MSDPRYHTVAAKYDHDLETEEEMVTGMSDDEMFGVGVGDFVPWVGMLGGALQGVGGLLGSGGSKGGGAGAGAAAKAGTDPMVQMMMLQQQQASQQAQQQAERDRQAREEAAARSRTTWTIVGIAAGGITLIGLLGLMLRKK